MKKCTKCKTEKELEAFPKDSKAKSGLYSKCKECKNQQKREWYSKNKDFVSKQDKTPERRFSFGRAKAKNRNLKWNIEKEIFFKLIKKKCYYCGESIANEKGCGLDRLDNSRGYIIDNVVTACGICNGARNNYFTPEEWKTAITAILNFRKANRDENTSTKCKL